MESNPRAPSVTLDRSFRRRAVAIGKPRSLPIQEWSKLDRLGWTTACQPGERLRFGGAASYLALVSRADIANRYGLFLDFLQRTGRFDAGEGARTLVTLANVSDFVAELKSRVCSVTVWNSVYKLRRAAQLIAPDRVFGWLVEMERDIALTMVPRSKNDRLVLTERLVEAGFLLIREAHTFAKTPFARATGIRDGLLITLLALHPIRIKNFAPLAIGSSFLKIDGRWWISISAAETKTHNVDQRQVPEFMTSLVDEYVHKYRKVLTRERSDQNALWISSTTGRQMTVKNLGTLISKLTRETIGVDVSPHLFRAAGASSAALYIGKNHHLASALLGHRDGRITEEHYNLAVNLETGSAYAAITATYRFHRH
jgi:site-specific recombinase XerD